MRNTMPFIRNSTQMLDVPHVPRLACPTVPFEHQKHGWASQPWHSVPAAAALPGMALVLAVFVAGTCLAAETKQPNFVFILGEGQGWTSTSVQMDDTNPDSKSNYFHTPNLEKLASQGMRFAQFYAPSPRCTASRAALFTGMSPAQLHMTFLSEGGGGGGGRPGGPNGQNRPGANGPGGPIRPGGPNGAGGPNRPGANGAGLGGRAPRGVGESNFSETGSRVVPPQLVMELPAEDVTIGELLKQAGYATAHFGKWHVGRVNPSEDGFDENDGPTGNAGPNRNESPNPKEAYGMTDRGIAFMGRQVKAGKPFYLQLSHYPGGGIEAATKESIDQARTFPGNNVRNQLRLGPAAVALDMDKTIGMVLKSIDELGIADHTYVVYTADHGSPGRSGNEPLHSGKGNVYEGGIRVPMIIRGPGIKPGVCSHVMATGVDLYPTFADLAHVKDPLPKAIEGGSLTSVLTGAGKGAIKRPREEFVVHFPHYDKDNDGPVSAILLGNFKLIRNYDTETVKLFDLSKDLTERNDLAKSMPEKVTELDHRLSEYLKSVNAQMTTPNPKYDPTKATPPPQSDRKPPRAGT
jgi:arylsulfatase A-like enzyme